MRFGRSTERGIEPYHDRAAIEAGALEGRGLEIAFIEDPVDLFFIHVQGSARLRFADGGLARIAFDGKSGHPYTSIGRLAVERGLLQREAADKDGLEVWLKTHPREASALMQENRSYIFFRETEQEKDEGPLGAAGVPLTPFRSLAVDRLLHTFHTPIWVDAAELSDPERERASFRRLMLAEDTGSAIVGPARGDIFFGSGAEAGSRAGRVRHAATMVALVPRKALA
jgi:membrane-bound lytic murein transglycosylase A